MKRLHRFALAVSLVALGSFMAAGRNGSAEERAPAWSPDGAFLAYMCRQGVAAPDLDFEICVMNADGSAITILTNNTVADGTPTWSPDGTKIVFNRLVGGLQQLFVMNAADGFGQTQLTTTPGLNLFASFGEIKAGR